MFKTSSLAYNRSSATAALSVSQKPIIVLELLAEPPSARFETEPPLALAIHPRWNTFLQSRQRDVLAWVYWKRSKFEPACKRPRLEPGVSEKSGFVNPLNLAI